MILRKSGYTLLELFIVIAILGILMGAFFSSITSSRSSFQNAGYDIDRQQDARRAVDRIAWELKKSSTYWRINATDYYNLSINTNGDQLDFYIPIFNATNQIEELHAVRYYIGGDSSDQLIRKESTNSTIIASNIDNVVTQKPFFSFNNTDQTIIDIKIPVIKNEAVFTLNSQVNLRNRRVDLDAGVTVEEVQ
jgi:prepilin-type N-terminal cleavage/methylation domain-containing protein